VAQIADVERRPARALGWPLLPSALGPRCCLRRSLL